MPGPFHDNLLRDAAGEGEADECAAAGMGVNHLVLGEYFFDTFADSVTGPSDGVLNPASSHRLFRYRFISWLGITGRAFPSGKLQCSYVHKTVENFQRR